MRLRSLCLLLVLWPWMGIVQPVFAMAYKDRIAATVNGDVILVSDIQKNRQPAMRRLTAAPLGVVPPGKWPTEKEILDELIVMRLIDQEAKHKGVVVDDRAVDATIESTRERNKMTRDQFIVHLAAGGIDYSEYREITRRQMRLFKLIGSEVAAKVPLSEEDAQEYFKQNKGQIGQQYRELLESLTPAQPPRQEPQLNIPTHETRYEGGQVRLRRIVLKIPQGSKPAAVEKVKGLARQIYQEAETGADFAKLAKKYSQDQLTAASGGDLGLMEYTKLDRNFQQLVQRLRVGQVTPPLKTSPTDLTIFYLAEGKGRKEISVPIPEKARKQMEKQLKERMDQRSTQRRPTPQAESEDLAEPPEPSTPPRNPSKPDTKEKKSLGILSPSEEEEYEKERAKVMALMRAKRTQARMKEWIEELKKNAIIEIKL